MKRAFALLTIAMTSIAVCAQGRIVFSNRNISIASGDAFGGGNGNGTYNVPIWSPAGTGPGFGAGTLPGGVTVGLFDTAGAMLGSTLLRTDAFAQFFATSSQVLIVPNAPIGSTPTLIVRAWQGPSFSAAQVSQTLAWGEWSFTAHPLFGPVLPDPVPATGMTGWGAENGAGLQLIVGIPEPSIVALAILGAGLLTIVTRRRVRLCQTRWTECF